MARGGMPHCLSLTIAPGAHGCASLATVTGTAAKPATLEFMACHTSAFLLLTNLHLLDSGKLDKV
jgi:hypothetical protein